MMKLLLGGAAAAAVVAIVPAMAQTAPPPGVSQGTTPVAPVRPVPRVRAQMHRMPMMKADNRDEVAAHVRERFGKLDTNRDGFVTREEAVAAHKVVIGKISDKVARNPGHARLPRPDRGAMFDKLDTNKDGSISRHEFLSARPDVRDRRVIVMRNGDGPVDVGPGHPGVRIMRMHRLGAGSRGRMFETADSNRDGRVSLQEMTDTALRHFDSADANHDGKLSTEERKRMHPRVRIRPMQPA